MEVDRVEIVHGSRLSMVFRKTACWWCTIWYTPLT
jgi:hypothetical protein